MNFFSSNAKTYEDSGITQTPFVFGQNKSLYKQPTLSDSFYSRADFTNALKAPLFIPVINLENTIKSLLTAIRLLAAASIHLATGDYTEAKKNGIDGLIYLMQAIYFTVMAFIDTVRAILTLAIRLTASLAHASVFLGQKLLKLLGFASSDEPTYKQEKSTKKDPDTTPLNPTKTRSRVENGHIEEVLKEQESNFETAQSFLELVP